jgi:hypothetical protein
MALEGVIDARIDGGMVTFRDVVGREREIGQSIGAIKKVWMVIVYE